MNLRITKHVKLQYFVACIHLISASVQNVHPSLDDDPSQFPGHLEPLGAKQNKVEIETLTDYPSPKDFFQNYIQPGRPFLLKDGAKYQRAYKLWSDEYMTSFPEASSETVQVEPNKKEIRNAQGFDTSFKDFIGRYKKEKVYMVNKVPKFLQKDIMMPPPLRCNNSRSLMLDHVTWISSGGTKSVLHQDDVDNINCLFRGTKDLLFINPIKYGSKVPIDNPRGGYSSLDVDKVNFTKYPSMRYVEYIKCHMEEGDCLFIPWGWFHQVNSVANKDDQNIAVNIWFRHDGKHVPEQCELPEEDATLDKFHFPGMDSLLENQEHTDDEKEEDEESEDFVYLEQFEWSLHHTKHQRAGFKTFCSLLKKIPNLIIPEAIDHLVLSEEFYESAKVIFDALNVDGNKFIEKEDFDTIKNSDNTQEIENICSSQIRILQMVSNSLLIDQPASVKEKNEEEKEKVPAEKTEADSDKKATTKEEKQEL